MSKIRWALLAVLMSPAAVGANTGLSEAVSEGRVQFDAGRTVGIQSDSAVAVPEEAEVAYVMPTAVDGQGTEADPIPLPVRAKRGRAISSNFSIPNVPIRPKGIVILGILAMLATTLTAGGLLTES